MTDQLIETLERAQAQTWWLPDSAVMYEGDEHCLYRLKGRYYIVRFEPKPGEEWALLSELLTIVGDAPVRFTYLPHRHKDATVEALHRAGFHPNHCYEGRVIEVERYHRASSEGVEVKMVTTFEEMRTIYELRRQVFGSAEPEPEVHLRRYLREATSQPPRVRQFLAIDSTNGQAMSQAGMSIFPELRFSFLFAGGTLERARGRGAYTTLVAARVEYARSIGLSHVGLFARADTSAPIVSRQGFMRHGEMQDWNLNWR